eukprot:CAMPEP_0179144672 /NCGR_PEP_ID=MMETSP0796-20121207/69725_1 /TAXON_ID=73915 /ORGANISM="Pyrodinium bahamense, Strain pbaha01" /LENGTH=53 /DNA_ID=CAMNT_0020844939 /DNA_START=11 /DNA_END=169 /DNA_ORIENTATION=+
MQKGVPTRPRMHQERLNDPCTDANLLHQGAHNLASHCECQANRFAPTDDDNND